MNHRWTVLLLAGCLLACGDARQSAPHGQWAQRLQPEVPVTDTPARAEDFGSVRGLAPVEWPKR